MPTMALLYEAHFRQRSRRTCFREDPLGYAERAKLQQHARPTTQKIRLAGVDEKSQRPTSVARVQSLNGQRLQTAPTTNGSWTCVRLP